VRIGRIKYEAGVIDYVSLLQLQAAQIETEIESSRHELSARNRINLHLALEEARCLFGSRAAQTTTARNFRRHERNESRYQQSCVLATNGKASHNQVNNWQSCQLL